MIVCLYVDDLIYTQSDPVFLENFKVSIMTEFDMYDLGLMHYILGIDVKQSSSEIFISQKKYAQETLQMLECRVTILSQHQKSWD